jgi:putative ABC transport system permease protein
MNSTSRSNASTFSKFPKKKTHYTAVPLRILLHIAFSNIMHKKLRSALTILGVIIGIGSIFFLLSFGIGLQELVSKQVVGDESIKSIEVTTPNSRIIKLNEEAVNKLRTFAHADKVGTLFSFPSSVGLKGGASGSIVYGVDKNYVDMTTFNLVSGRLLNENDNQAAFVSQGTLKALGIDDPKAAIGQTISLTVPLNNVEAKKKPIKGQYEIIGVTDSKNGTEVYIPSHVFLTAGVVAYSQTKIIADNTKNVSQLRKQIESSGFETTSPIDTLDQINQIFKFFNFMLVGFGAIGMIVAVLGMFNTLTISLLERTQEIGLMMALGGRNSDMRKLFIFEALLLSVAGAATGIILAVLAGFGVDAYMNHFAQNRGVSDGFSLFSTPPLLVVGLMGFMVVVGLMVVYIPARRAQKISPIDALRRE